MMKNKHGFKSFWERQARHYPLPCRKEVRSEALRMVRGIESLGVDFKGRSVLDIGCGTGIFGVILAEKASRVLGLDASAAMLRQFAAQARLKELSNVSCLLRDWNSVREIPGAPFDIALTAMSIVQDRDSMLRMEKMAGRYCVHVDWAGQRKNPFLDRIFAEHGLVNKAPDYSGRILGILKGLNRDARVKYIGVNWYFSGNYEEALANALANLDQENEFSAQNFETAGARRRRVPVRRQWLERFIRTQVRGGRVAHKTRVRLALIVWRPAPAGNAKPARAAREGRGPRPAAARPRPADLAGLDRLSAKLPPAALAPERITDVAFLYRKGEAAAMAAILSRLDRAGREQAFPFFFRRAFVGALPPAVDPAAALRRAAGAAGLVCAGRIPPEKLRGLEKAAASAGVLFRHLRAETFTRAAARGLAAELRAAPQGGCLGALSAKAPPAGLPPERLRTAGFLYFEGAERLMALILSELDSVCLAPGAGQLFVRRAFVKSFGPGADAAALLGSVPVAGISGLVCAGAVPRRQLAGLKKAAASAGVLFRHLTAENFNRSRARGLAAEFFALPAPAGS
ncbi:MAG TPA: class I SAM-dependent methyltransferase [Elusimicrobiales bacterium]|nr:class I SAM-dependent methyltransferase [Elusimicrobiales bacterium]